MTLIRVSGHWLWLESISEKRDSSQVESPFFSTWLESSPSHQKSWLKSRYHWIEGSHFGPDYTLLFWPISPARGQKK